ncbi:uncharacterized protein [Euwallacea similis]|uniref:uncharacterized protein n=1 Tax=Euwallacea similis TaxID=1736056 RepID=UPI00344CABEE
MKSSILLLAAMLALSVQADRFDFFSRQELLPNKYGPPAAQPLPDGALNTTETSVTTTDKDTETIDADRARKLNEKLVNRKGDLGVYYIYHPTGLLQKVSYSTKDDPRKMAFAARLKYENVEPIVGPVYTYDPQSYVFKRLQ